MKPTGQQARPKGELLTRNDFVSPMSRFSVKEHRAMARCVDLRDNHTLVRAKSGYIKVVAIDREKRFGR